MPHAQQETSVSRPRYYLVALLLMRRRPAFFSSVAGVILICALVQASVVLSLFRDLRVVPVGVGNACNGGDDGCLSDESKSPPPSAGSSLLAAFAAPEKDRRRRIPSAEMDAETGRPASARSDPGWFDLRGHAETDVCAGAGRGQAVAAALRRSPSVRQRREEEEPRGESSTGAKTTTTTSGERTTTTTTSLAVIREAQCIQVRLFSALLGTCQYAVLVDLATYENKGDPAIAVGELLLLKRIGVTLLEYCTTADCGEEAYGRMRDTIEARGLGTAEVCVLMQGGGNLLTSDYRYNDWLRRTALEAFGGYRGILFPQSIWIQNGTDTHLEFRDGYRARGSNLTVVLRDERSLGIAREQFRGSGVRLALAPDMAMQLGPLPRTMFPSHDILWQRREDAESTQHNRTGESQSYAAAPDLAEEARRDGSLSVEYGDYVSYWRTPQVENAVDQALVLVQNGLTFLQRGRVLVTDRLHGHILATLLDIPHVIVDNVNGKLTSYHRTWTAGVENIAVADNDTHALSLAKEMLRKYGDSLPETLTSV